MNDKLTAALGFSALAVPLTGLCIFIVARALLNPVNIVGLARDTHDRNFRLYVDHNTGEVFQGRDDMGG